VGCPADAGVACADSTLPRITLVSEVPWICRPPDSVNDAQLKPAATEPRPRAKRRARLEGGRRRAGDAAAP